MKNKILYWLKWPYRFYRDHQIGISITFLIILFFVVLFAPRIFILIPAGDTGVIFKPFKNGVQIDTLYGEGLHVIYPWNEITKYELRIQRDTFKVKVLSEDGMYIDVEASLHYRPDSNRIALLHQKIGPDYLLRVVRPIVISNTREIFGRYRHQQIYMEEEYIEEQVIRESIYDLKSRFVTLLDIPFHKIELPKMLTDAIEDKVKHEQIVKKYDFMIQAERKEAERKQIEAVGIREFQRTVSQGITKDYLIYNGIQATLDLAKSNNAKVVVIGNSKNGLPLILDTKSENLNDWINGTDNDRSRQGADDKTASPKNGSASSPGNTGNLSSKSPNSINQGLVSPADSSGQPTNN